VFKIDEIEFYLKDLKSRFDLIDKSKYYLSYSGGKDSHFLLWFIKEYLKDEKITIVSVNTYMEHQEIFKRMKKYADEILIPKMKPFEVKEKYGSPCFSKTQDDFINRYQNGCRTQSLLDLIYGNKKSFYNLSNLAKNLLLNGKLHKVSPLCCEYLKKKPFMEYEKLSGKKAILGVRGKESLRRSAQYKTCLTKDGKFTPLHDLDDELLDKIYKKYNIEIPKIYDYVSRTGCAGCPYGSWKGKTKIELDLLPDKRREFVVKYFKESYDVLGIDYKNKQLKLDFDEVKENE